MRLDRHQGLAVNRIAAEGTAEPPVGDEASRPLRRSSITDEDDRRRNSAPNRRPPTRFGSWPQPEGPGRRTPNQRSHRLRRWRRTASIEAGEASNRQPRNGRQPARGRPCALSPAGGPPGHADHLRISSAARTAAHRAGHPAGLVARFENADLAEEPDSHECANSGLHWRASRGDHRKRDRRRRTFFRWRAAGRRPRRFARRSARCWFRARFSTATGLQRYGGGRIILRPKHSLTSREAPIWREADPWGFILFARNIGTPEAGAPP